MDFLPRDYWSGNINWFALCLYIVAAGLVITLAVFIATKIYELIDRLRGETLWFDARVEEKHFTPESDSDGTAAGPVIGGGYAILSTSSHTDSSYMLLLDVDGQDEFEEMEVSPKDYKHAKVGVEMRVAYTKGGISGDLYGPTESKFK